MDFFTVHGLKENVIRWEAILGCNSLLTRIPNVSLLWTLVVESVTKITVLNMERKKNEQIQGRTNWPENASCPPHNTCCNHQAVYQMWSFYCKNSKNWDTKNNHCNCLTNGIQSTLVISTSVISNNRLPRRENLILFWHRNLTSVTNYFG